MSLASASSFRGLLSPIGVAAYLALIAVWLTSVEQLAARDAALAPPARAALVLFTLAFLSLMWPGESSRRYWLCVAAMALGAFGVLWLGATGASGILLVLLVAVLASKIAAPAALAAAMIAINLALLAIVSWRWGMAWEPALATVAGIASFQLFAALLMRYADRAETMAEALRASNADLLATRELLAESARDAERLHLSRELHDIAGHKLTALKLNLAALARERGAATDGRVRLCADLADELLADIRGVVEQMRGDEGVDLAAAMRALAAPFPRPRTHLEIAPGARAGSLAQAEALLRTVQEALTNAARHSQAGNLWVVLQRERDRLLLDIRDDGRGTRSLEPGNGLTGMRERLETLGGGLRLRCTETGGVHLHAWLPGAA